jgi:hypothetical protein
MIQTYLEQNHIDVEEGNEKVKITYAGYAVPHPLRDELVVRIGVTSKALALKAFAQACRGCVKIFRDMRQAWITVMPEAAPIVLAQQSVAAAKAGRAKFEAEEAAAAAAFKEEVAAATEEGRAVVIAEAPKKSAAKKLVRKAP